ncbi:helix-turn-helix domain-containing protein [Niallia sp. 01092]|uniref:helix-turn-helix domain-containing protein n=1 Tax=unclassified Niallia TaxID=2837522 RepID=UPI003FCF577B
MCFPERLRKLRKDANLTQSKLGEKMNVTKVSISGYETGNRRPDTETLQRLADFFHVSTDYLLGRSAVTESAAAYSIGIRKEQLIEDDYILLSELKKYPYLYSEIRKDPQKNIKKLNKMWSFLQEEGKK